MVQANELREQNQALFHQMGIKRIVTACADCHEMLKKHYDLESLGISVEHFAQTLADLLARGKLRLNPYEGVITYHDPCQLARKEGIIDEPRAVLGAIAGLEMVEMKRSRKGTQCCGGGPNRLVHLTNPQLSAEIADDRMSEAQGTGANALVTACSWCHTHLENHTVGTLPVYDLPYFVKHVVGVAGLEQMVSPGCPQPETV